METETEETCTSKKDPFEQLSKEELIKKCRQFLTIAQKAKQSKDELVEENKSLNNKLKEYESKFENDSKVMEEMINVLTLQKLDLVNNNDVLTKQNLELKNKFLNCQQELIESNTSIQNQDIENQGFSRQIKRLTEENDQLISHLDQLEKRIIELNKIGEQQRIQLLALEKQNVIRNENQDNLNKDENTNTFEDTDNSTNYKDLEQLQLKYAKLEIEINNTKIILEERNTMIDSLNEEIDTLKMENTQINELKKYCQLKNNDIKVLNDKIDSLNIIIGDLNVEIKDKSSNIVKLTNEEDNLEKKLNETNNLLMEIQNKYENLSGELEITKKAKENNNEKLKSYHSKLIKVYNDLKDLKLTKNKLLGILDNYSNYINKWQSDIKRVSNKFKEEIEFRDTEINSYKHENSELNSKIVSLKKDLIDVKLNNKSNEYDHLNTEIKLKDEKITSLFDENEKLHELVEANNSYVEKLELCMKENASLIESMEELKRNSNETNLNNKMQKDCLLKENEQLITNLSAIKENLKSFEDKLLETQHALENKISQHVDRINSNEELLINIQNENKLLKDNTNLQIEEINTLKSSLQSIEDIENENCKMSEELKAMRESLRILTKENNDLQKIVNNNKDLETNNNKIKIEYKNIKQLFQQAELKSSEYMKTIEDLKKDMQTNYISNEKFINLSKINNELTEKIDILNVSIERDEKEISSYERDCSDLRNQISISKRENAELLREMNDMNQALKERGETISKQQEYAQELIRKIQNLEQESKNCKEENVKFEAEIALLKNQEVNTDVKRHDSLISEKNEIIKSLEEEIKQLKESFNSSLVRDNQDGGDGETMSTSTISRTEDASRLRDLEGSWEERYTKLRTLALKLKGKVKELTEQLNVERIEKSDIQNKVTSITRNLQSIQSEYDKLQDQFENVEKENKKKLKQIETLTQKNNNINQELKDFKDKISKLEIELDLLRKEKLGSNSANKHYTAQIQNLKKEIEDYNNKIKDLANKITKLEGNLSSKEQDLQNETKNHNSTKEKLQKIEKENKKNSVLSLEMEDYERSLKELSQKLEKKNELILKFEEKNDKHESSIFSLKNQIKMLEEINSEKETYNLDMEKRLLETQTKISSSEATTAQKENRIREILKSLEEYKSKSEEENTGLTQSVVKNQQEIELLKTERDHSRSVVLGLEEKIREITKISNGFEEELDHLKNEYSNYKVRAQSVLRQNQTRDVALEERLTEEVSELKSKVELLNTELEITIINLKTMSEQYEMVKQEKNTILLKNEELEQLIRKQKEDHENLLTRQQQLVSEHRESMRAQKVHTDTLTQCYKQQLSEQEERHVKELTELKALQIHSNLHISKSHEDNIDVTSMPREDGEGSESIGSNNYPSKSSLLSLDKLLNPDNDVNFDYETELAQLKKRVTEYDAKVSHLTDLLADTEQDLAKHAQLNQHLKEEIRRHQRSVEREKHAENLEYLKNVVFKFLILHNGDEKSHLVPVLNTILKLSPEETQKLNAVAKGTDLTRGWGSYLPLWSGSNNQN